MSLGGEAAIPAASEQDRSDRIACPAFPRAAEAWRSVTGKRTCQPACKPGSVWRIAPPRRPFLWGADRSVPRATNPGGGEDHAGCPGLRPSIRAAPIRSCSRWGLPCRLRCRTRGALLPHRFTLAFAGCPARAVCSLWHFPWGRPRRPLAATVDPWSPDFPPPRPMAAKPAHAAAAVRPAGRGNKGGKEGEVKRDGGRLLPAPPAAVIPC